MEEFDNSMAKISLGLGVAAIVGHGFCCIPLLGYIAVMVVPILTIASVITGIIAITKANAAGAPPGMAYAGVGTGVAAGLVTLAFVGLQIFLGAGIVGLMILSEM